MRMRMRVTLTPACRARSGSEPDDRSNGPFRANDKELPEAGIVFTPLGSTATGADVRNTIIIRFSAPAALAARSVECSAA